MPIAISSDVKGIVDVGLAKIDEAIHLAGEDAIIAYLVSIYRTKVAPLDIPYVPEVIEVGIIDPLAEAAIGHLVRKGHAAVHRQPLTP